MDHLAMDRPQFLDLLKADERNPLQEMLWRKAVVFHPEAFWSDIAAAAEQGIRMRLHERETRPTKMTEHDLTYNLARFGYREFGAELQPGENICVEYTVVALWLQGEARRMGAVPVLLAKNRVHYNILIFLCQKYSLASRLFGVLKALHRIRPSQEVADAITTLQMTKVRATKVNEHALRAKLRLYHVA
jgi:hypothetical protein